MKSIFIILFLSFNLILRGQGIIVNEISNGSSGSKEFIELIVIGSSSKPLDPVDLSGWVVDDNNGDFESSTSAGVASGHYRFVNTFPPVPVGSIIVLYNNNDINDNMIPDDELDIDNDGVYVLPINSIYLERCTSSPSSTLGPNYTPCTYSNSPSQTWTSIGLRNGGDAVQVRKPDFTFYHGFSYGDVLAPYPTFPTEFGGGSSFNVMTGSGTDKHYFLDCGDWTLQTNYGRDFSSFDSPGLPNTGNNIILINSIKNGTFNYDNLGDPNNCAIILDNDVIKLRHNIKQNNLILEWYSDINFIEYNLYESNDGIMFDLVNKTNKKEFIKNNFTNKKYYKVCGLKDSEETCSDIIFVENETNILSIFPNPTDEFINVINSGNLFNFVIIYNNVGQEVLKQPYTDKINISHLKSGMYLLKLFDGDVSVDKFFIKS